MEDNKGNNKIDGYITLGKAVNETMNKINIPNQELIYGTSRGVIDAIKPIVDYNFNIANLIADQMTKQQRMFNAMIEPITEMTRKIINLYEPIMNNAISSITRIFEKIDWSQFDLVYKEIVLKYLSNGFYPYYNTEIDFNEILKTNNKTKLIKIIKVGIRTDIINNKKELLTIYPQYKREIKEIYKLYKEHSYRLCILSLINLISIINNTQFEYIDFTEKHKVRKRLLEKQIMSEKETNYMLFAPYINDEILLSNNKLIKNCQSNPAEYLNIPYNRNAILHGYSKKFGSEANCLRWFSVLINTMEISEEIIKTEEKS